MNLPMGEKRGQHTGVHLPAGSEIPPLPRWDETPGPSQSPARVEKAQHGDDQLGGPLRINEPIMTTYPMSDMNPPGASVLFSEHMGGRGVGDPCTKAMKTIQNLCLDI